MAVEIEKMDYPTDYGQTCEIAQVDDFALFVRKEWCPGADLNRKPID